MSTDAKTTHLKPGLNPNAALEVTSAICTDIRAAQFFTEDNAAAVRWVPEWGWIIFDGKRWLRDTAGLVYQAAENVGQHFREQALDYDDPNIAKALFKWAKHVEGSRGIRDFLTLCEWRLAMQVDDFDTHGFKFNTPSATLDFEGLDAEAEVPNYAAHNSANNLTRLCATPWNMNAAAPTWATFLERVLPDEDVRAFVQMAVGYSILGLTAEQCFFVLYGSGANGKSTFLNVLQNVLGVDYATQVSADTFMPQQAGRIRSDLARLRGMRLVVAIETAEGKRLDEPMVKALTGGDRIVAEHKYKTPFSYRPEFTIFFATNHRPRVTDTSPAMWRRVRLIPFTVTVPPEEQDPHLEQKLMREAEGILNWVIEGAIAYQRAGRLYTPEAVTAATDAYRLDEDIIGRFLEEACYVAPVASCSKRDLYEAYVRHAEGNGERPYSQRRFSGVIGDKGFDSVRAGQGQHMWLGLGVKEGS